MQKSAILAKTFNAVIGYIIAISSFMQAIVLYNNCYYVLYSVFNITAHNYERKLPHVRECMKENFVMTSRNKGRIFLSVIIYYTHKYIDHCFTTSVTNYKDKMFKTI